MIIDMSTSEREQYDSYVNAYEHDYPGLTDTDKIQLRDAASYYILNQRLINSGHTSMQIGNVRTSPKTMERNILADMAATRQARQSKQPDGLDDDSRAMRDFFLQMSAEPPKPPRRVWVAKPEQVQETVTDD